MSAGSQNAELHLTPAEQEVDTALATNSVLARSVRAQSVASQNLDTGFNQNRHFLVSSSQAIAVLQSRSSTEHDLSQDDSGNLILGPTLDIRQDGSGLASRTLFRAGLLPVRTGDVWDDDFMDTGPPPVLAQPMPLPAAADVGLSSKCKAPGPVPPAFSRSAPLANAIPCSPSSVSTVGINVSDWHPSNLSVAIRTLQREGIARFQRLVPADSLSKYDMTEIVVLRKENFWQLLCPHTTDEAVLVNVAPGQIEECIEILSAYVRLTFPRRYKLKPR